MKQLKYTLSLSVAIAGIVLMLAPASCDKDSDQIPSDTVGPVEGGYDPVFSADGGFVITYGMLDKQYNEITFPGTHNSHTNGDAWIYSCDWGTKNQDLTIPQQLRNGIRFVEFDINCLMNLCHGVINTDVTLYDQFVAVREYAAAHPGQIITVRISDVNKGEDICDDRDIFCGVNTRLEWTGLDQYIYNYDATEGRCSTLRSYIPEPWPTLREMIESGKNVMFFHSRDYYEFGIIDEAYAKPLDYGDAAVHAFYEITSPEGLCNLVSTWSPPQARQKDIPYRLILMEYCPDGCDAGDRRMASINNDGRRIYKSAKFWENELLPFNRRPNFMLVDFFGSTTAGALPINVVDAANRLNYERFGIDWENSESFWELYPYEFDNSKVEHIHQTDTIRTEVDQAISEWKKQEPLGGSVLDGLVRATGSEPDPFDWRRLPEWAVDGDFCTRWCSPWTDPYTQIWSIDLGERKAVNEIAIAWEYPHHRPGYIVFASNNDSRFADGISYDELYDDTDWIKMAEGARVAGGQVLLWDKRTFNGMDQDWRYIKIAVTERGEYEWPTFWEVRLYGPAD